VTAGEARNHQVRLSFLFYSHATIVAGHKQYVAVFADSTFILSWQAYFCGHSYFSGSLYVAASESRIFFTRFFSLLKENFYTIFGYLLCGGVHF